MLQTCFLDFWIFFQQRTENLYEDEKNIQNHLQVISETLPNHTNYLHLNTQGMMIQCFYHNSSCILYLLLHIYVLHDIFCLKFLFQPSTTYQYQLVILILSVFFKRACHANPGADKKRAGSSSYISVHLFQKFSNTSASNNVSL